MAILQVRDIDDRIYENLKRISQHNKRSISQEVIHIIEIYLSNPERLMVNSTEEFLKLSGSWIDERPPNFIVNDLKKNRTKNTRFTKEHVIFD